MGLIDRLHFVLLELKGLKRGEGVFWSIDDDPVGENLNLALVLSEAASVPKDCSEEKYWLAQRYGRRMER